MSDEAEVPVLRPVAGNSLAEVMKLGQVFKASGYFRDIRDEAQAVTKILYGRELGFTPIVSIMGIHIIEGKPALSSNLLATLIKRSGKYDYRIKENTATRCSIEFRQGAEILGETDFTIEEARTAGVVKPGSGWTKYPKAMLFARALSAGVRAHCPDVTACPMYVPEELGATVTEDGEVTELPKSARGIDVTTEDIKIAPRVDHGTDEPKTLPLIPYCGKAENTSFYAEIRKALPGTMKVMSEEFGRKFLAGKGYKRADGEGTLKGVEKALFPELMREAVAAAADLNMPGMQDSTDVKP